MYCLFGGCSDLFPCREQQEVKRRRKKPASRQCEMGKPFCIALDFHYLCKLLYDGEKAGKAYVAMRGKELSRKSNLYETELQGH